MRVIGNHDAIPYGLSMRKDTQQHVWELWFVLPVIRLYKRRYYEVNEDRFVDAWKTLRIALMMGRHGRGVIDLRFARGWA